MVQVDKLALNANRLDESWNHVRALGAEVVRFLFWRRYSTLIALFQTALEPVEKSSKGDDAPCFWPR